MSSYPEKDPLELDIPNNSLNKAELKEPIKEIEQKCSPLKIQTPQKDNSQFCLLCAENFTYIDSLLDHIHVDHSSQTAEQCIFCHTMIEREDYPKHMNAKHKGHRIFRCKFCNNRFTNRSKLNEHVKKFHETQEKPFKCEICCGSFKISNDIQEHMSLIHNKIHKCKYCVKCYGTFRELNVHIEGHMFSSIKNQLKCFEGKTNDDSQLEVKEHCDKKRVNFCLLCEKSFVSFAELEKHIDTHVEDKPFECPYCADLFEDLNVFKGHIFQHTTLCDMQKSKNGEDIDYPSKQVEKTLHQGEDDLSDKDNRIEPTSDLNISNDFINEVMEVIRSDMDEIATEHLHVCDICEKVFKTEEALNSHLANHSEAYPKDIGEYCGEELNFEEHIEHYKKHKVDTLFLCPKNEAPCFNKQNLNENVNTVRDFSEMDHECTICNLTFKTNDKFLEHNQMHSGNDPYTCDICKKTFTNLTIFTDHKLMHSKKKEYQCYVCGIFFKFNGNLKVHMRIHTGEKPYKCKFCNKKFARMANLNEHLRTHTKVRSYQCKYCEKKFHTSSSFSKHQKCHFSNKRMYKCTICDKSFLQKVHLNNHIRTHTRENPFKCHICGKFYRRKDILKQHLKLHLKRKKDSQYEDNSVENVTELNQDGEITGEQ